MENQDIINALLIVITEFEEKPIANIEANDTMIQILSERIEELS